MSKLLWLITGLVFLGIVILVFRSRRQKPQTLGRPPGFRYRKPDLKRRPEYMDWWRGSYKGVEYTVEQLADKTITVWIEAPHRIGRALEINPKKGKPLLQDSRAPHIQALLDSGAVYIDVAFNTNWIAAEFPLHRAQKDKELLVQAAEHLVEIRILSEDAPPKPPAYRPR